MQHVLMVVTPIAPAVVKEPSLELDRVEMEVEVDPAVGVEIHAHRQVEIHAMISVGRHVLAGV